ncbi:MAG: hypothetical protein ABIP51_01915 [Bacteroidia bacterium]
MKVNSCLLTGYPFDEHSTLTTEISKPVLEYEHSAAGKVKIAVPTAISIINSRQLKHPVLAGICRNAFENNVDPPIIDTHFMTVGVNNIDYPNNFKEKTLHLLNFMYKKGGKSYEEFQFVSTNDYPIAFATDEQEFTKIIKHLESKGFIEIGNELKISGFRILFKIVRMTDLGIEEIEKDLPKIPLIGLVDQEISTGDSDVDKTINHAKKLFFHIPSSMDNMRSACESLSYVLEPLRKECEKLFSKGDISDFFQIVNEFDIRHNKKSTKEMQLPEQLEWVFYSLLNTINTYTKLKSRKAI